jgi:hypothetical protein
MRTKKMTRIKLALVASMLIGRAALAHGPANQNQQQNQQQAPHRVDLVIALDTSSSMNGLVDAARQKLWDVVNLLAQAKPRPQLRVGLISYGNTHYDATAGWVRKDMDLTSDLDAVYSKLFALTINGGDEYVARAVDHAVTNMQWDQDKKTLKIVFVAGNEPANQDPKIPIETAVHQAREKGIFVNSIYCGSESAGEASLWRKVAELGAGKYAAIDHNRVVAINTPMDSEIAKLNDELNKTYVAYGRSGGEKQQNQLAQDKNARSMGGMAASSRSAAKASALYMADDWDLVDAKKKGKKVAEMKEEEMPAELRNLKPAERDAYVDGKAKERAAIQGRIAEVNKRREAFIAQEQKKRAKPGSMSFDDAMLGSVKTQAESVGFGF